MVTANSEECIMSLQGIHKGLYDAGGRTLNSKVKVLENVNFSIYRGEVHVLLGENGAGKSSLMKVLCGVIPADEGRLEWKGSVVKFGSANDAYKKGIGLVAQEFSLCPNLTIAENIWLGREPKKFWPLQIDKKKMRQDAVRYMKMVSLDLDPDIRVRDLTVAHQQLVEISKALSMNPEVLILDEPTSALADNQVERLFSVVENLIRQDVSIIFISHKLNEVMRIGHKVTVLRDGKTVETCKVKELDHVDDLVRMMVGRKLASLKFSDAVHIGKTVLKTSGITRGSRLQDLSIEVHEGEIVGLAGIVGAGRTEFANIIFGVDSYDSGSVEVFGKEVIRGNPGMMIKMGVGFVPEDRKRNGVIPQASVAENICTVAMGELSHGGFLPGKIRRHTAIEYIKKLNIVCSSTQQQVQFLSGGNQQKVILGKWLCARSKIFIFDEPTRGIDVGAKAMIYELIHELAGKGAAVLLISSELPELLNLSHKLYVMRKGRIVKELARKDYSAETILHYAMSDI